MEFLANPEKRLDSPVIAAGLLLGALASFVAGAVARAQNNVTDLPPAPKLAPSATTTQAPAPAASGLPGFKDSPISDVHTAGDVEDVHIRAAEMSVSLERLTFNESDGTSSHVGLGTLFYHFHTRGYYWGLGAHAALFGSRGGLNGIGIDGGKDWKLDPHWTLRAGLGISAIGGVKVTTTGAGGLLLRPSALAIYDLKPFTVGGGFSTPWVPGGTAFTLSPVVTASLATDFITTYPEAYHPGQLTPFKQGTFAYRRWRLSPLIRYLSPAEGQHTTPSADGSFKYLVNTSLLGARATHFMTDRIFTDVEIVGAASGGVSGFLSIGGAVGYQIPIAWWLVAEPRVMAGGEGGARMPTGGGLFVEPGLRAVAYPDGVVSPFLGYGFHRSIAPIDGTLRATVLDAGLAVKFSALETQTPLQKSGKVQFPVTYKRTDWRMRGATQHYFIGSNRTQVDGNTSDMNLMAIGFDAVLGDNFYLSAIGTWPYSGGAWGYAAGLLGVGYESPINSRWSTDVDLRLGPASGGGLPVGNGFLVSPGVGAIYYPEINNRDLSVELDARKLNYYKGLSAWGLELGLRYGFEFIGR